MDLQHSFRAVANAVDQLPPEKVTDFLARLVLILANEINNGKVVDTAVQRALAAVKPGEQA